MAVQATQVLHCNLNVVDIEGAAAFYEDALHLTVRMRSESVDGDSTQLGITGSTHSIAWFLYDHRGGHLSPAIELVEWRTPATAGVAYEDPTAPGMQSLIFTVPSVGDAVSRIVDAGGTTLDSDAVDRDGVRIELAEDLSVGSPTFTGVRLNCVDLETTEAWYRALGWEAVGPRSGTMQRVALGAHPFELHLTEWPNESGNARAHADANARGLFRMALAVDDVRAACETLQRGGPVQVGEPTYVPLPGTPLGGLWVSFFRDPNGVTVELVERVMRAR